MFLKLGWPKVLTFHFYVTRKHKISRDFFFFNFAKKKKKIQVHFDTYLCIPSREIKICHFVFLFYQYSPFLFPQKVNLKKKKKPTLCCLFNPILYLPSLSTSSSAAKQEHSTQFTACENQKPKTSATFTRVS